MGNRMRGVLVVAVAVATAFALSGCGAPTALEASTASPTTQAASPTPTRTAKPSPTPSVAKPPTVVPVTFSLECRYEDPTRYDPKKVGSSPLDKVVNVKLASFEAAWAAGKPFTSCDAIKSGGKDYTSEQVAAANTAGYDSTESVKYLYAICGATAGHYVINGPVSENQQAELAGVLMICPNFPAAEQLRASSAAAQQAEQERAQGIRFWGAGVYAVGTQVQPGTYRTTGEVKNCYWARLDPAAEIIDNNFISAATQAEVTVQASDFSLSIEGGCGEWVKIG